MGCTSLYIHVNNNEGVAGFRRDATYSANLHIKVSKWHGRKAIKQYKTSHTYFFHTITTSDGWIIGTGGADNPSINKAIENLARLMVKNNNIKKSSLKKIQNYEKQLRIGHFAIKSPTGKYAVVWSGLIKTGKMKNGEYLKVPNAKSLYKHDKYSKFSKDPTKAGMRILASDSFGVNRRDATIFHWMKTTVNGSATSKIKVYGANDCGSLSGRSTAHLKDNIQIGNKFYSKNSLPKTPEMKLLKKISLGKINNLKTQTIVKAPEVTNDFNKSQYFKATIKEKNTKKPISKLKIILKIDSKTYVLKTYKQGIIKFNTELLDLGKHKVTLYTNNEKYYIFKRSEITILDSEII